MKKKALRVLISDKISRSAIKVLEKENIKVDFKPELGSEKKLASHISNYDGLIIRSASEVNSKVLSKARKLTVIGRAGIGVDNIDIEKATEMGIVVMNTPYGNAVTTAEHSIAMMFAVSRQISAADQSTQKGRWEKAKFMGQELTGKVLGLIGVGNIGSVVAERAFGLKLRVIAFDPFLTEEKVEKLGIKRMKSLEQLISESDIISLHLPKTEKTEKIIDEKKIKLMKKNAILINCARGGLVDENALAIALRKGSIAGAGFDVFGIEPAVNSPLFGLKNMVCTPHLGASTVEAQEKVAIQVSGQVADFLKNGAITNSLNAPSISAEEAPILNPWIKVSDSLGSFIGQIVETAIKEINIEYVGSVGEINTKPLTRSMVAAMLNPIIGIGSLNLVSSLIIARDRGIKLSEIKKDTQGAFESYIRVIVKTESFERSVAGTVYSDGTTRFIQINGINMDTSPQKYMIFTSNNDTPGYIGSLGTLLGKLGVNIATFSLGRQKKQGLAIALLGIDDKIDANALNKIKKLKYVKESKFLKFNIGN